MDDRERRREMLTRALADASPPGGMRPATWKMLQGLARATLTLSDRVRALEAAVEPANPEARLKGLHLGSWEEGRTYPAGTFTTHGGSLWWATAPTSERPGQGKTAWRLVVKRGRAEKLNE
jgi:hypothetical protein